MSLFRIREWWATQIGTREQFDSCLICVGSILESSASESRDQLIVGSHSGVLRVYDPASKQNELDLESLQYSPEHLLLEKQLELPILQVATGNFSSAADNLHIAVLHARKLCILCLQDCGSGQVEHGNQYILHKIYEHPLQRTAYNFVYGPFGGVKGRDFICIQSLDGTLSFFEQENFAFTRFLPNCLLPGPLCYVPMADSFLTVSSQWQLESYKYHMLAVAADSQTKEEAESVTTGKRVAPDWIFQLGEEALNLAVIEMSPAQPSVFVLGRRTIFCFTEGGTVRFMKKLDYVPTQLMAYCATSEGYIQYAIGTQTNTVTFYSDVTLRWAAQLPFVPVGILRAKFSGNLRGLLCAMDETGHLLCGFLGTDPAFFGIPQTDFRHVDFFEKQRELKKLQAIIKTNTKSFELKPSSSKIEDLVLSCHIPPKLDDISVRGLAYDTEHGDEIVPSTTVRVVLHSKVPLENVQVFVLVALPVVAHQQSFSFSTLNGSQELPVTFFVRYNATPSSLDVTFKATYTVPGGASKVIQCTGELPLQLLCKPCSPWKSALCKITLDSTKPTVNLNDVFTEFLMSGSDGAVQSMGFQLLGTNAPTYPPSWWKCTSEKYRIQSDTFEATWVFMKELIARLSRYHAGVSDYRLSFNGNIPLAEYFALLDHHFELEKREQKLNEVLSQRCSQLRAVQRQLLSKFKDTTPTPLAHLDGLLEMSHRQVLNMAGGLQELMDQLRSTSAALEAATHMLLCLLNLQNAFTKEEAGRLRAALIPDIRAYPDQSWEERTDASVTHLLHIMSKGHAAASPTNHDLPKMTDTTRLKKHIALLCDKFNKGAGERLRSSSLQQPKTPGPRPVVLRPRLETIIEDTNTTDLTDSALGEISVPSGSAFGTLESGSLGRNVQGFQGQQTDSFESQTERETESSQSDYLLSKETAESEVNEKKKKDSEAADGLPDIIGSDVPDLDELGKVENNERGNESPDIMANGF